MQFKDLEIGQTAQTETIITDELIQLFAKASGDVNPIHLDDEFAKTTPFGQRIAHGMLVASFISSAIANKLPGHGTVYRTQSLKFKQPTFIGDTVTTTIEIKEMVERTHTVTLKTKCVNQDGKVLVMGEAVVIVE